MELTKEEYEAKLADLQNQIDELKKAKINKYWKPQYGESYYTILGDGSLYCSMWVGHEDDQNRFMLHNCFKTEEEARFEIERLRVIAKLEEFSESENREWDGENRHYYIAYHYLHNKDTINVHYCSYEKGFELYFESEEDAWAAIEAVGQDKIKKYYLKIKD